MVDLKIYEQQCNVDPVLKNVRDFKDGHVNGMSFFISVRDIGQELGGEWGL